jgi:hypothetical protein
MNLSIKMKNQMRRLRGEQCLDVFIIGRAILISQKPASEKSNFPPSTLLIQRDHENSTSISRRERVATRPVN